MAESPYGWPPVLVDSAALLMLNEQQFYLFGHIQTSQTGGQLCSDTFPYEECSLLWHTNILGRVPKAYEIDD